MLINLKCPNCQGAADVDDSKESATCKFCGSKILIASHLPGGNSGANQTPVNVYVQQGKKSVIQGCIIMLVIFAVVIITMGILAVVLNKDDEDSNPISEKNGEITTKSGEPVINSENFISAASKMGYTMIIEEDYDGFNTYWAGAHKFAEGVIEKEGNEIYVIDYTKDATIHNSKIEYLLYVDKVKEMGGISNSESGSGYEYQVNSSETRFGIAYRIGDVNLYVVADAEYKDEILAFFDAIGFGVKI
ncbi:MAG: hypothetical protein FWG83_05460 [Oscillospiraceae bacterium]|nr:hypothetical protein [Oscillospiraceae bacterium]